MCVCMYVCGVYIPTDKDFIQKELEKIQEEILTPGSIDDEEIHSTKTE